MTRPAFTTRSLLAATFTLVLAPAAFGQAGPVPGAALPADQPVTAHEEVPGLDTSKVWPCVQRKMETVSVSQVWDGPPIEGIKGWYKDKELVDLVDFLASRRVPLDEAEDAIKAYAEKQPADQRDQSLTTLFAALFDKIQSQRRTVLSGIEKYQKSQIARSQELERQSTAIAELEKKVAAAQKGADPSAPPSNAVGVGPGEVISDSGNISSGSPELDQAREHFNWAQRIFQERQQSMPLACELPGVIDERLYALAHSIRGLMTS